MRSILGNVSVEFAVGMVVIVLCAMAIIDVTAIILGAQYNDYTCTEAARMASQGPPDQANARASAVVARAKSINSWFVSNLHIVGDATIQNTGPPIGSLQQNGGPVVGTVAVCTEVTVQLPIALPFPGSKLTTFQTTKAFPFTYIYPTP
ncbi:MAG TPA: hypothetical protein V6C97_36135 [Oculatellaceae cyanobacterium]